MLDLPAITQNHHRKYSEGVTLGQSFSCFSVVLSQRREGQWDAFPGFSHIFFLTGSFLVFSYSL